MTQDNNLAGLFRTVQEHKEQDLQQAMVEAGDWCHMYHLARGRRNLVEWLPLTKTDRVLEIGGECGALTGFFAEKTEKVVSVELSREKAEIAQVRHAAHTNITYISAKEMTFPEGMFDYIFAIGSFPLAEHYVTAFGLNAEGQDAYAIFLQNCKKMLKKDGRLILALPNQMGLKYFAGCREDYTGAPFTGLEGYYYHKGIKTFGKRSLQKLLQDNGFAEQNWYYPYPDYRFANSIYSDNYLPKPGELHTNLVNFDQERYVFFDETKAYDTILKEDLYPELCNSYLVVTGKETEMSYVKFSGERQETYALYTGIKGKEGTYTGYKRALYQEGTAHVSHIAEVYEALEKTYEKAGISFDKTWKSESDALAIDMEILEGRPLQEILEDLAVAGKVEEIRQWMQTYTEKMLQCEMHVFEKTEAFTRVFGNVELPEGLQSAQVTDIDLILSNIFVTQDGEWKVIDYEWTFDFPVPYHFVLYRAYYFAYHQITRNDAIDLEVLLEKVGIDSKEAALYMEMEKNFQNHVRGNVFPERDMLGIIGNGILPFGELDAAYREKQRAAEEPEEKPRGLFFRKRKG